MNVMQALTKAGVTHTSTHECHGTVSLPASLSIECTASRAVVVYKVLY